VRARRHIRERKPEGERIPSDNGKAIGTRAVDKGKLFRMGRRRTRELPDFGECEARQRVNG
jgi:hypothetical protein